eukprot:1153884-Pelagomonas_calceolata.AAC.1
MALQNCRTAASMTNKKTFKVVNKAPRQPCTLQKMEQGKANPLQGAQTNANSELLRVFPELLRMVVAKLDANQSPCMTMIMISLMPIGTHAGQ